MKYQKQRPFFSRWRSFEFSQLPESKGRQSVSPLITLAVSKVCDQNDALAVWHKHRDALENCLFVLSQPGPSSTNWPAKLGFKTGGYLTSIFSGGNLWFTSHDILRGMAGDGSVDLALDYSIGFDSNIAQYLLRMVEGRTNPEILGFRESLRELATRRFNWEMMPFLCERADAIAEERDVEDVRNIVHAAEYFSGCDLRQFAKTGELELEKTKSQIDLATESQISEWRRVLHAGELLRLQQSHSLYRVLLLKIVAIHRANPSSKFAAGNFADFLEFMCGEINIQLPFILWAASEFFERSGTFEPLRKLTRPPRKISEACRNVAWDFMHYVRRREYVGLNGRNGSFLVPYTFTYDRGLAELMEHEAQRSCLLKGDSPMPQFFGNYDLKTVVIDKYIESRRVREVVTRHLTIDAHLMRVEHSISRLQQLKDLIFKLESQVCR